MTRIEQYKEAKRAATQLRAFADEAQNPSRCDKFGAKVELTGTYRGSYGSSSVYQWPDAVVDAMQKEIGQRLRGLSEYAADRAEKEAEGFRQAARDEAKEVLRESDGAGHTKE